MLYYDGTCRFCRRWANRFRGVLGRRGVALVAYSDGSKEEEMRLHWMDGRDFGGIDALLKLAEEIWWARPLGALSRIPGVVGLWKWLYREFARRRHCWGGACRISGE